MKQNGKTMKTVKDAVDRLGFRISNHWKHNQADIDAYNKIVEYVEKKNEQQFNDNQLFGKIFITFYGELLKYYKASVFDKQPQIDINKMLAQPMESVIQKFLEKANEQELYLRMKEAGISDKHPLLKTDEEKENEKGKFKMEMLDPVMTEQEATDNLSAMINNALNSYN